MKFIKKIIVIALLCVFIVTVADIPSINNPVIAEAATIKINKTKLSLQVGKTYQLKITGTTKKVTWSSSKKSIATVTSKGLVTAKKAGTSKITAKVANKSYTCTVTVKKPANPYIENAPFDAVEKQIGNISLVIPKDWDLEIIPASQDILGVTLTPKDANLTSSVLISISTLTDPIPTYEELKSQIVAIYTEEYFTEGVKNGLGELEFTVSDFAQDEITASFGKVLKTEYLVQYSEGNFKQYIYDFILENVYIEAVSTDINNLELGAITEYVINSITVK